MQTITTTRVQRKKYVVCQSCGMPFSKNKNNFFRITSGFYDVKYCTDCFQNDRFTNPDYTIDEMNQQLINRLRASGMRGNLDRFTERLNTLERWKS